MFEIELQLIWNGICWKKINIVELLEKQISQKLWIYEFLSCFLHKMKIHYLESNIDYLAFSF